MTAPDNNNDDDDNSKKSNNSRNDDDNKSTSHDSIASGTSQQVDDENKKELLKRCLKEIWMKPENQVCCDCSDKKPTWASLIVPPASFGGHGRDSKQKPPTIGAFCCFHCSGIHRSLGTHICFVRSVTLDNWKENEVLAMQLGGNEKINAIFEARKEEQKTDDGNINDTDPNDKKNENNSNPTSESSTATTDGYTPKPNHLCDMETRKAYIREKYVDRKFFNAYYYDQVLKESANLTLVLPPPEQQSDAISINTSFSRRSKMNRQASMPTIFSPRMMNGNNKAAVCAELLHHSVFDANWDHFEAAEYSVDTTSLASSTGEKNVLDPFATPSDASKGNKSKRRGSTPRSSGPKPSEISSRGRRSRSQSSRRTGCDGDEGEPAKDQRRSTSRNSHNHASGNSRARSRSSNKIGSSRNEEKRRPKSGKSLFDSDKYKSKNDNDNNDDDNNSEKKTSQRFENGGNDVSKDSSDNNAIPLKNEEKLSSDAQKQKSVTRNSTRNRKGTRRMNKSNLSNSNSSLLSDRHSDDDDDNENDGDGGDISDDNLNSEKMACPVQNAEDDGDETIFSSATPSSATKRRRRQQGSELSAGDTGVGGRPPMRRLASDRIRSKPTRRKSNSSDSLIDEDICPATNDKEKRQQSSSTQSDSTDADTEDEELIHVIVKSEENSIASGDIRNDNHSSGIPQNKNNARAGMRRQLSERLRINERNRAHSADDLTAIGDAGDESSVIPGNESNIGRPRMGRSNSRPNLRRSGSARMKNERHPNNSDDEFTAAGDESSVIPGHGNNPRPDYRRMGSARMRTERLRGHSDGDVTALGEQSNVVSGNENNATGGRRTPPPVPLSNPRPDLRRMGSARTRSRSRSISDDEDLNANGDESSVVPGNENKSSSRTLGRRNSRRDLRRRDPEQVRSRSNSADDDITAAGDAGDETSVIPGDDGNARPRMTRRSNSRPDLRRLGSARMRKERLRGDTEETKQRLQRQLQKLKANSADDPDETFGVLNDLGEEHNENRERRRRSARPRRQRSCQSLSSNVDDDCSLSNEANGRNDDSASAVPGRNNGARQERARSHERRREPRPIRQRSSQSLDDECYDDLDVGDDDGAASAAPSRRNGMDPSRRERSKERARSREKRKARASAAALEAMGVENPAGEEEEEEEEEKPSYDFATRRASRPRSFDRHASGRQQRRQRGSSSAEMSRSMSPSSIGSGSGSRGRRGRRSTVCKEEPREMTNVRKAQLGQSLHSTASPGAEHIEFSEEEGKLFEEERMPSRRSMASSNHSSFNSMGSSFASIDSAFDDQKLENTVLVEVDL